MESANPQSKPKRRPKCKHCRTRNANKCRGLCYGCYYDPKVRPLYGLLPESGRSIASDNQTPAELEAVIAEQSANLPAWWDDEARKPIEERVSAAGPDVSTLEMRQILMRRYRGRALRSTRSSND